MRRTKTAIIFLLGVLSIIISGIHGLAQQPRLMNSVELKIGLEKMLHLGSVLYIAAHPDDENTAILAYMSKEKKMRTGYLSITRGDGGQNLIGSEKGPLMGLLRTYELLEARKIDGAEQFFTRAIDFGYSKTTGESLDIWGKENILEDMVFIIRKFQPDIIISRFSKEVGEGGHGHHTASAVLAQEAFEAAGDASKFPGQLKEVSIWKAKRFLWNTWRPYMPEAKPEDTAKLMSINVGQYNRLLGKSYIEIASLSRSMHKSQGFGSVPMRGERLDYFDLLGGEKADKDMFEGIDTTWNRVPGSEKIRKLLEKANESFQFDRPDAILPILAEALDELKKLKESYWTTQKTMELKEILRSCAGMWLEAMSDSPAVTRGQDIKVTVIGVNRSNFPMSFKEVMVPGNNGEPNKIPIQKTMEDNKPVQQDLQMNIPQDDHLFTHPYWLKQKPGKGIFNAENHGLKGMAVAPYPFYVTFVLEMNGKEVSFDTPVLFRERDPVEGERIHSLIVTPPVTANFMEPVIYFPGKAGREIPVILGCGPKPVKGTIKLYVPNSWKVEPEVMDFSIDEAFGEKKISFKVTPGAGETGTSGEIRAEMTVEGNKYGLSRQRIAYPHLPVLTLHPEAKAELVQVEIKGTGKRVGYVMGSGDDIPQYLTQVGFQVDLLTDEELRTRDLRVYDAIVVGVRGYNTREILKQVQPRLLDYVSRGGRMIVQYNVSRGLKIPQLGPYPFQVSSNRVTEEDAVIKILDPKKPLFLYPHKIEPQDFDGWVQERGLYFADRWDPQYTPLLSCYDTGDKPQEGGLLLARYGKGIFIYTGYAFFRQIPAGVRGALKLFTNMISMKTGDEKQK